MKVVSGNDPLPVSYGKSALLLNWSESTEWRLFSDHFLALGEFSSCWFGEAFTCF